MKLQWGAILGILLFFSAYVEGKSQIPNDLPSLTVLVCDKVGLDAETLRAAQDEAIRIWHAAGVNITWVEASGGMLSQTKFDWEALEDCQKPSSDFRFNYFLVITRKSPRQAKNGSLGIARLQPMSQRAYILFDRVQEYAKTQRPETTKRDVGIILGHAAAHELGHLFLASEDHSARGIMSTNWGYLQAEEAVAGSLLFQSGQVRYIQNKLRAR